MSRKRSTNDGAAQLKKKKDSISYFKSDNNFHKKLNQLHGDILDCGIPHGYRDVPVKIVDPEYYGIFDPREKKAFLKTKHELFAMLQGQEGIPIVEEPKRFEWFAKTIAMFMPDGYPREGGSETPRLIETAFRHSSEMEPLVRFPMPNKGRPFHQKLSKGTAGLATTGALSKPIKPDARRQASLFESSSKTMEPTPQNIAVSNNSASISGPSSSEPACSASVLPEATETHEGVPHTVTGSKMPITRVPTETASNRTDQMFLNSEIPDFSTVEDDRTRNLEEKPLIAATLVREDEETPSVGSRSEFSTVGMKMEPIFERTDQGKENMLEQLARALEVANRQAAESRQRELEAEKKSAFLEERLKQAEEELKKRREYEAESGRIHREALATIVAKEKELQEQKKRLRRLPPAKVDIVDLTDE